MSKVAAVTRDEERERVGGWEREGEVRVEQEGVRGHKSTYVAGL